ncbi:CLUMA_CG008579, isoform A [Clunio marinus]|uniref:CLUMA_CG008579, isoform A n=1 Tax=Clunio marinus TaxID=568069 RepID=A0A1J1I484_9DIPT|nr:CLUMA_CG008579, isoform A [Clunio marinus]
MRGKNLLAAHVSRRQENSASFNYIHMNCHKRIHMKCKEARYVACNKSKRADFSWRTSSSPSTLTTNVIIFHFEESGNKKAMLPILMLVRSAAETVLRQAT